MELLAASAGPVIAMLRDTEWILVIGGIAAFLNAVTVGTWRVRDAAGALLSRILFGDAPHLALRRSFPCARCF